MRKSIKTINKVFKLIFSISNVYALLTVISYIINSLMPAIFTYYFGKIIDTVYQAQNGILNRDLILRYALVLGIVYAINQVFQFINSISLNGGVFEKSNSILKFNITEKISKLNLLQFEDPTILTMKQKAEDCVNDEVVSMTFMITLQVIGSAITVISIILVLNKYSIWLTVLSFLSMLPYFISKILRGGAFYKLRNKQAPDERELNYLWGLFTNKDSNKELRVFQSDKYIANLWINLNKKLKEELWSWQKKDVNSLFLCDILKILGFTSAIAISIFLAVKEVITIGAVGACLIAFQNLQDSTKVFLEYIGVVPRYILLSENYFYFMNLKEEEYGINTIEHINTIDLSNVYFKYPLAKDYALKNINLNIERNETIAIVGENGSGKTTLSKVILGFYPIEKGELLWNGEKITHYNQKNLMKSIAIVSQNFTEYNMAVKENIDNSYDMNSIIQELSIEEILNEKDGLNTLLGRKFGGTELSGGQWQRLAIARCLFKDGSLLLLDEPTSAIDPLSESEVLKKFLNMSKDKTSIIISHRIGICKFVDRIIVMKDGEIVEEGSHSQLIEKNGEYQKLYEAQSKWYCCN